MWIVTQFSIFVVCLVLFYTVTVKAWRQHGFIAPLGFFISRVIDRMILAVITGIHFGASDAFRARMKRLAESLEPEETRDIISTVTQSPGILEMTGYVMFFLCALLDLQSASEGGLRRSRIVLVIMGCVLCVASRIYPWWTMSVFAPDISFANPSGL